MTRNEEDLGAIGNTVLSIRNTVERHSSQLFKIRGDVMNLSEKLTDVREEVLNVKFVQDRQSRVMDEHSQVLGEHGEALAEILRRLPARD